MRQRIVDILTWPLYLLAACLIGNRLLTRNHQDADEGTPWDWGDPDCPGYRPDLTRAQRIESARQWRERMAK